MIQRLLSVSVGLLLVVCIRHVAGFTGNQKFSRLSRSYYVGNDIGLKRSMIQSYQAPTLTVSNEFLKATLLKASKDDETDAKKGGIETKYLIGWGAFLVAALYDFFVTHGGQPYLVHP